MKSQYNILYLSIYNFGDNMDDMKDKIAHHSRKLFDIHGYHGAALRDICELAGCKMPTIYYYYENKEKLFDQVVREAFQELVPKLWSRLPQDVSYQEYDTQMVIQKKYLSEEERIIYRLAMKTWLGVDGCAETRRKLIDWGNDIFINNWNRLNGIVISEQWSKFISRSITEMIQRIILMEEDIPDNEIYEVINMIYDVATHKKTHPVL